MAQYCKQKHLMSETRIRQGSNSVCGICVTENRTRWRKKRPDLTQLYDRRSSLKRLYGINEDDYEILLKKQKGRCAICRELPSKKRLHVDHDHKTLTVRGLLCGQCNTALGLFKESSQIMLSAVQYVQILFTNKTTMTKKVVKKAVKKVAKKAAKKK